ncbi:MAG: M23 family metallopeptidase [Gammaproteobacteria bacterium]|nr:M23 family metallopeptidase [Gammaproteobacteria bacterium]
MHADRIANHALPAALGIVSALLLGGAGFGLGCLFAVVGGPAPAVARAAPSAPPAVTVAPTPGMGGPEEPAPAVATADVRQVSFVRGIPAPGVATGRFGPALAIDRPVAGGWVSSHFGRRADPFTGQPSQHRGLDFAGLDNSAILAVAPGVVSWSGRQRGYGNLIEIDHGGGWVTRYGHNASNLVAIGDYVKPGQTIALMGATGRATGTHLHFEVLFRGRHQNPARFLPQDT